MSSHLFLLSSRSRRALRRNQRKDYQKSVAGHSNYGGGEGTARKSIGRIQRVPKRPLLWDPVAFLPPEIAVICLTEALPSGSGYPAALLDLISVASGWQNLLFSVPSLWSKILVRYTAYDLLATISVFLHLSANAPLQLTVWNTLGSEWNEFRTMLLPHAHRIHGLVLGDDPPIYSDSPFAGAAYISLVSDISKSLDHLPFLIDLDFGRQPTVVPSQLKVLELPSTTRVRNTVQVSLQKLGVRPPLLTVFTGSKMEISHFDELRLSDLLRINAPEFIADDDFSIGALNSSISTLTRILSLLDSPSTSINSSISPLLTTFINRTSNRCLLCQSQRESLAMALGCVRSHFGLRSASHLKLEPLSAISTARTLLNNDLGHFRIVQADRSMHPDEDTDMADAADIKHKYDLMPPQDGVGPNERRETTKIAPFQPRLQVQLNELQNAIYKQDFVNKGKFPPDLKPILYKTAITAISLGDYNGNFFNYLHKIFPYNRFTITKLTKRIVYRAHCQLIHECQDALLDELAQQVNDGMDQAKAEYQQVVILWEGRKARRNAALKPTGGIKSTGKRPPTASSPEEGKDRGSDYGDEDDEGTKDKPPSLRYRLNEAMRGHLWALVQLSKAEFVIANENYHLTGSQSTAIVSEQSQRKQLYKKIVQAFPVGWMTTGIISREVSMLKKKMESAAVSHT